MFNAFFEEWQICEELHISSRDIRIKEECCSIPVIGRWH
jgi:hypothetical protein